jgi:putative sugar O-methyltransferase
MKKTSISDYNEYKTICQIASEKDEIFKNFKQNFEYKKILEHANKSQGDGYINRILELSNIDLTKIEIFKTNDEQGSPDLYDYPEPFGRISPSTLRYIKVLSDLINHFGDLSNMSIVEVGVGYGGQSKIIQDYFNVKEYNYIDLPEVMNLTKKYLKKYDYENINFLDFNNLPIKKYDLVISNYAITECTKEIQDLYFEKVINNSKKGYITGNDIGKYFNINNYSKLEWSEKIKGSLIFEENPKTHEDNYLLIFK